MLRLILICKSTSVTGGRGTRTGRARGSWASHFLPVVRVSDEGNGDGEEQAGDRVLWGEEAKGWHGGRAIIQALAGPPPF